VVLLLIILLTALIFVHVSLLKISGKGEG